MLRIIAVTFNQVAELTVFCSSLILQTNPDWELLLIHDGPIPEPVKKIMSIYNDPRIRMINSEIRHNDYGHSNRRLGLNMIDGIEDDYVYITNADNYVVPTFIEQMLGATKYMRINGQGMMEEARVGIVYCDTVHSHYGHALHKSALKEGGLDMGSFIVRYDIAKSVGFTWTHYSADGAYAEAAKNKCDAMGIEYRYIPKPLFVHN